MASAVPTADDALPVCLLPADGVRWCDVRNAVRSAGSAKNARVHFAVVSEDIGANRSAFCLTTIEGFPASIVATRSAEGIVFEAVAGPYPELAAAREASAHIQAAATEALLIWGTKPELPGDEVAARP